MKNLHKEHEDDYSNTVDDWQIITQIYQSTKIKQIIPKNPKNFNFL